jgi:hypothetical protein
MLNLEITNKCKLKCPGCMRQINKNILKGTSEITLDRLKIIFDTFPSVNFCGTASDPIYHKDFHEILEYITNNNFDESDHLICTNGHGFDEEWWTKSFELTKRKNPDKKIRWRFGIDGLPKDSHKYRILQDGEQVWEMMKLGSKMDAHIEWQYIVFNYNQNDIDTARKMAEDHGMFFIETHSDRWYGKELLALKPSDEFCS